MSDQQPDLSVNLSTTERQASVVGGVGLVLFGLGRRSNFGALIALLGGGLIYRGVTGHCPGYAALGKDTARTGRASHSAAEPRDYFENGVHVEQSVNVKRPAADLFRFWRNFENLPRFMPHLESVTSEGGNRSRWTAKGPAGTSVSWNAEIINEEPDRLIAWRSVEGADVDNAGSVRFIDAGNSATQVKVVIDYIPPGGQLGNAVAALFGEDPARKVADDLERFRQVMESENAASAANPT